MKEKLIKAVEFVLNPKLLLCLLIGWMITNGWSYAMFGLGTVYHIKWMIAVSGAYIAFLWLPVSPEKLATIAIAILLLRKLFPNDQHTLAVLVEMNEKIKKAWKNRKHFKKRKKE